MWVKSAPDGRGRFGPFHVAYSLNHHKRPSNSRVSAAAVLWSESRAAYRASIPAPALPADHLGFLGDGSPRHALARELIVARPKGGLDVGGAAHGFDRARTKADRRSFVTRPERGV